MRLNILLSFTGFLLLITGTYCPILRPFHLMNWDVYDGSKPYGILILLVGVVGLIGTVFNQTKIIRLTAWISLVLIALFYVLAFLKVHTSFTFIPFHSVDAFLTRQIRFKWGWYILFLGPMLAITGTLFTRKNNFQID